MTEKNYIYHLFLFPESQWGRLTSCGSKTATTPVASDGTMDDSSIQDTTAAQLDDTTDTGPTDADRAVRYSGSLLKTF